MLMATKFIHAEYRNDKENQVEKRQKPPEMCELQPGKLERWRRFLISHPWVGSGLEVGRLYILSCTNGKHLSSMITCEDDINNKISKLSFV